MGSSEYGASNVDRTRASVTASQASRAASAPGSSDVARNVRAIVVALTAWVAVIAIGRFASAEGPRAKPLPEKTSGPASLRYVEGFPVLFLSGSPEELGRQHGELVGETIRPLLEIPRKVVADHGFAPAWPLVTAMARILLNNAPEPYRQELDALIAAGKLDRDGVYVGNSLVELRRMGGCSAFVVTPERSATGELLFGRNFDFPPFGVLNRFNCLLVVRPEGKRAFLSIGYPGMIGVVSGMNDAGLVVATLDVYESADGAPIFDATGVPLAFTYRRILEECATVEEAEQLLKSVPRTTYMNLATADARRAVVFEITPQSVGVREPQGELLCCTNHFQLAGLKTDPHCERIDTLNALRRRDEKFGVQQVQQACTRSIKTRSRCKR